MSRYPRAARRTCSGRSPNVPRRWSPPLCAIRRSASASSWEPIPPALRVGQHGETRDHVPSRLIGMVGIRIESACRHGPIPVERQQMHGHGIPLVEFRPPVTLADAAPARVSHEPFQADGRRLRFYPLTGASVARVIRGAAPGIAWTRDRHSRPAHSRSR